MSPARETWWLMVDPGWTGGPAPLRAVAGAWPVIDGVPGRFRANPAYLPADPDSPTDPLDAVLRGLADGTVPPDQAQLALGGSVFELAVEAGGRPFATTSPDGVACVVVATSPRHRTARAGWRAVDLEDLVDLLADGVDVLVNPGGPHPVRLAGDFVRAARLLAGRGDTGRGAGMWER